GRAFAERAAMPTSRGGAAGAVGGGRIVVAGGEGNSADPSGVFPQVEVYDPARDAWDALPPMVTPRHGTGGAPPGASGHRRGGGDAVRAGRGAARRLRRDGYRRGPGAVSSGGSSLTRKSASAPTRRGTNRP